jgi:hydrogen cyanide synthase HcnC
MPEFEFAVIGGGLVGTAIAYGLARSGKNVAVFDEGDVAFRAARGNFGLVWVQGKGNGVPAYSNWTQRSARRWPEFAALLREDAGVDVALSQPGGFQLCLSDQELELRTRRLAQLVAQPGIEPYEFETLGRDELAGRLPDVGPDVVGATYTRLDGHVNALRLLRALHLALRRHRGAYLPESKVERITRHPDGFAIDTGNRAFVCANVVLAAGLGNAQLAPQVGLRAPVRPQRGQIIVLERVKPFLHAPLATLRQTDEGSVLVGDSQEEAGFDDTVGLPVLATMAERAVRMFPALAEARVVRTWAALRVMSPDGYPVYEQSADSPGAWIATCHSGVTLAAAHALELAPQIAGGALDLQLEPFASNRFDVQKAA